MDLQKRRTIFAPDKAGNIHWMNWTRKHLPNCKDYWITDLDSIHRDRDGNLMLLELKCKGAQIPRSQEVTLQIIDAMILAGMRATSGVVNIPGIGKVKTTYWGCHSITWSGEDYTGAVTFDSHPVTEENLIKILSFDDNYRGMFVKPVY